MTENAPFLPCLSPISGKPIHLAFDVGRLAWDGALQVIADIGDRVAERLTHRIAAPRAPKWARHAIAEMIRLRNLMIVAGY